MIRAFLDANTVASGATRFREGTSPPALILQAWALGRFELLISDPLLEEVIRTLAKPFFRTHVEPKRTFQNLADASRAVDADEQTPRPGEPVGVGRGDASSSQPGF